MLAGFFEGTDSEGDGLAREWAVSFLRLAKECIRGALDRSAQPESLYATTTRRGRPADQDGSSYGMASGAAIVLHGTRARARGSSPWRSRRSTAREGGGSNRDAPPDRLLTRGPQDVWRTGSIPTMLRRSCRSLDLHELYLVDTTNRPQAEHARCQLLGGTRSLALTADQTLSDQGANDRRAHGGGHAFVGDRMRLPVASSLPDAPRRRTGERFTTRAGCMTTFGVADTNPGYVSS